MTTTNLHLFHEYRSLSAGAFPVHVSRELRDILTPDELANRYLGFTPDPDIATRITDRNGDFCIPVRLEHWRENDTLEQVGEVQIPARTLLDSFSLEDVESMSTSDCADPLFAHLAAYGLISHDGPYTVDTDRVSDQYSAYVRERTAAGRVDVDAEAVLALAEVAFQVAEDARVQAVRAAAGRAVDYVLTVVRLLLPEAKEVVFSSSSAEHGLVLDSASDAEGADLAVAAVDERLHDVFSDLPVDVLESVSGVRWVELPDCWAAVAVTL